MFISLILVKKTSSSSIIEDDINKEFSKLDFYSVRLFRKRVISSFDSIINKLVYLDIY